MNKKILLFMILCISLTVNAEMIMPSGLAYAVQAEQNEKAYSVILANDTSEALAINTLNTQSKFEDTTMKKNRTLSYRFITSNILNVESVLRSGLSPLKPDKPHIF